MRASIEQSELDELFGYKLEIRKNRAYKKNDGHENDVT